MQWCFNSVQKTWSTPTWLSAVPRYHPNAARRPSRTWHHLVITLPWVAALSGRPRNWLHDKVFGQSRLYVFVFIYDAPTSLVCSLFSSIIWAPVQWRYSPHYRLFIYCSRGAIPNSLFCSFNFDLILLLDISSPVNPHPKLCWGFNLES